MTRITIQKFLLLTTAITLALPGVSAQALPTGGSVSSGTATISNTTNTTTVNQTTNKAVINWTGFNTASGETVQFNDPSSSAITLNRVSGGPTVFGGTLKSNGNVWIINPNGLLINSTGKVNTAGFLATTSNITDANFSAGKYSFTPGGGSANATITNAGTITVAGTGTIANAGLAALVAPNVANSGIIAAKTNNITLASGDTFTVDLVGDGLINLAASKAMVQQNITNSGTIDAPSHNVVITAAQASNVLDNLINLDGAIEANNVTISNQSGDLEYGAKLVGSTAATGGNLTLNAYRNISVDSNTQIAPASGKLNVTLDANDSNAGSGSIFLASGSNIATNGGNIILGGGTNPLTGYAIGNNSHFGGLDENGSSIFSSGVYLNNATLNAQGGNLVINGQGYAGASGGASVGVNANGANIFNTGSGVITINGKGGNNAKGSSTGVDLTGSTSVNGTDGAITVTGTAATAQGGNADGIIVDNYGSILSSGLGNISVTGTGGVSQHDSKGIFLGGGSDIRSISETANTGNITFSGTGGTGFNSAGFDMEGDATGGTFILSNGGNLAITGKGGNSITGGTDVGVYFGGSETNSVLSSNKITITGTGGGGTGNALYGAGVLLSNVNLSLNGGDLTVTGTGGTTAGSGNYGIQLSGNADIDDGLLGNIKLIGTGGNSAAAIESDNVVFPGFSNGIFQEGGNVTLTGLNNSLNLNNLVIEKQYGNNGSLSINSVHDITMGNNSGLISYEPTTITLNANDTNSGSGSIVLNSGTSIESDGGNIILSGAGSPSQGGYATGDASSPIGIALNHATLNAGGGSIFMSGEGYGAATGQAYGIFNNGSTISTTGSGNINMIGIGGSTGAYDGFGVFNTGLIQSVDGSTYITGIGSATADRGAGYLSSGAGSVQVTGKGSLTVTGEGGHFKGTDYGISATTAAPTGTAGAYSPAFFTNSGALTLNGTGGGQNNNYYLNDGIILNGATVSSVSGNITLNGTAGTGSASLPSYGIHLLNAAQITMSPVASGSGIIVLDAISAATKGLYSDNTANRIGGPLGGIDQGNIYLEQDTLALGSSTSIQTLGTVTVAPYNAATSIGFSGGLGTLGVTQAIMDDIHAPTVVIGRADSTSALTSGTFNWESGLTNLYLESGAAIIGGNITRASGANAANLYVESGSNISLNDKASISGYSSAGPLNVTFDANDKNIGGSIYVGDGSAINSDGGSITLGGGTNPLIAFAVGNSSPGTDAIGNSLYANGIYINGGTLNAGGGNITLNGEAPVQTMTQPNGEGVRVHNSPNNFPTIVTTGNGTITVNGVAQAAPGGNSLGVDIEEAALKTAAGNISIDGLSGNAQISTATNLVGDTISTTSGAIAITGNSNGGLITTSQGVNLSYGSLSTNSGAVTITGTTAPGQAAEDTAVEVNGQSITSNTGKVVITGTSDLKTSSSTGVEFDSYSKLTSTGTGANAATFTVNGTGGGLGIVGLYTSYSTVDGNFYFNGISGAPYAPTYFQNSQFTSTGKGKFIAPGAVYYQ